VYRDFYATSAQVLPVLMLALLWESRFLERLRGQKRLLRTEDPVRGVRFWTKPRVRIYSIVVATTNIGGTGLAVAALAGLLRDQVALRAVVLGCLLLGLLTLLTRITVDVVDATHPPDPVVSSLGTPSEPAQ
jgi:hypothetical protein